MFMDRKPVISTFTFLRRIVKLSNNRYDDTCPYISRGLRKLMSNSLCLWRPEHRVVWDICCLLFRVFAFLVACLDIASSERPLLSQVTSSYFPVPNSKSLLPSFVSFMALISLWDGLSSLFASCPFLTLDSNASWMQWCNLFHLNYLWMFRLARGMWSFSSRWMNQWINLLKTANKINYLC